MTDPRTPVAEQTPRTESPFPAPEMTPAYPLTREEARSVKEILGRYRPTRTSGVYHLVRRTRRRSA